MQTSSSLFKDQSLTEIEVFGLKSSTNFADGHSYLDTELFFPGWTKSLPEIWNTASRLRVQEMELRFRDTFADFYGLEGLKRNDRFSICPTASNSIDVVGAFLRAKNMRVGLMEPTFDNLALLLKRREVSLFSIEEFGFHDHAFLDKRVKADRLDALMIVNPNNPSGKVIGASDFKRLANFCAERGITLIIDASFRFCHLRPYDDYKILSETGVSHIIFEDTGKCWPTLDTKASILVASPDHAPLIRTIYEEIYLCCSNFSLALIEAMIRKTQDAGGLPFVHSILAERNEYLREVLKNTALNFPIRLEPSSMSVAWIDHSETGLTDLQLVEKLAPFGIAVLPGRYFYWNSHDTRGHDHIRIALMKPERVFYEGAQHLKNAIGIISPRVSRVDEVSG